MSNHINGTGKCGPKSLVITFVTMSTTSTTILVHVKLLDFKIFDILLKTSFVSIEQTPTGSSFGTVIIPLHGLHFWIVLWTYISNLRLIEIQKVEGQFLFHIGRIHSIIIRTGFKYVHSNYLYYTYLVDKLSPLIPLYGLLMTSALDVKARVIPLENSFVTRAR